jgi:DNA-binding transcriptional ArsR family regulator
MYKEFRRANRDFKSIVDALTTVLRPDIKGLALEGIDPGECYSSQELYDQTVSFCGFNPLLEKFPVTLAGVWVYFYGFPTKKLKGSLASIGMVVESEEERQRPRRGTVLATVYQKTDAGTDIADPLVARGTHLVNMISKKNPKFSSMLRLWGAPQKTPIAEHGAGYRRFRLIELLSENPKDKFRREDILKELPEFDEKVISVTLRNLGDAGFIDYFSPSRGYDEIWNYALVGAIDEEEAVAKIRKLEPDFSIIGHFRSAVRYMNESRRKIFNCHKLSAATGIPVNEASSILSILNRSKYLESGLGGGRASSLSKSNEITMMIKEELIYPIRRLSNNLNPNFSGFRDALEYYLGHKNKWKEDKRRQVLIYDREKTHIGPAGGDETKMLILGILAMHKKIKRGPIKDEIDRIGSRKVDVDTVNVHLKSLKRERLVRRDEDGFYSLR